MNQQQTQQLRNLKVKYLRKRIYSADVSPHYCHECGQVIIPDMRPVEFQRELKKIIEHYN